MKYDTATRWIAAALLVAMAMGVTALAGKEPEYQDTFRMENCDLRPWGVNDYFTPLVPGYALLLEGEEDGETVTLLIDILRDTRVVDGVRCAILRETEWADGELAEISWNYYAICKEHKEVFYFGEDVDNYEDGVVVDHGSSWLAGVDGARAGLIMPGYPLVGSRYYQEVAPDIALDRAEHLSVTAVADTPAGVFEGCLYVLETTPLEPKAESIKVWAPGVGLVADDELRLVEYGSVDYEAD